MCTEKQPYLQGEKIRQEREQQATKPMLSKELKVACEIWHYNTLKKPIWFTRLVESLAWCMTKNEVSASLDTLTDWLVIYGEYGATDKGRAGYNYHIDTKDDGDFRVRDLYERYWKDVRQ